jgi:HK97 gp10 family phage protein
VATHVRIYTGRVDALIGETVPELVDRCLDAGVEAAKRLVPVDTGTLQGSIGITEPAHMAGGGVVGAYGTSVEYALHVEFGTSKMSAQPYLRPSVDAVGVAAGGP